MRSFRLCMLASCALMMAASLPAPAMAEEGCPPVPAPQTMDNAAFYGYVHTFDSRCASHRNWDRSFDDVQVSTMVDGRNRLSVTAATSLGGALASLRVNEREFLASGGHGSALQWAFHAWNGGAGSECYNPTQAGSRADDAGPPPFHGPSTSALYVQSPIGTASLRTTSRLAMYIPRSSTTPGYGGCIASDHQPDRSPFTFGLSPYWLDTLVQLGPGLGTYFPPSAMPSAYYWIQTEGATPYNGMSGAFIEQITVPASGVGQGGLTRLDYEAYLAVGNLSRVMSTLDSLDSQRP